MINNPYPDIKLSHVDKMGLSCQWFSSSQNMVILVSHAPEYLYYKNMKETSRLKLSLIPNHPTLFQTLIVVAILDIYPSETHLKLKSRKILFAHNLLLNC